MANDRLYIVCQCGEWTMLFKYYPTNGYMGANAESFLQHHSDSCAKGICEPGMFSLVWENTIGSIWSKRRKYAPSCEADPSE